MKAYIVKISIFTGYPSEDHEDIIDSVYIDKDKAEQRSMDIINGVNIPKRYNSRREDIVNDDNCKYEEYTVGDTSVKSLFVPDDFDKHSYRYIFNSKIIEFDIS